jgi:ubiquinone/menaquinone biosynthesis C-methylase UbiE
MVSFALDSSALAESYDRVSDRQFNHGKLLLADLGLRPGDFVLDVGAGTGRLAKHAAGLVGPLGKVVAVDPLPLRIELAKKNAPQNLATRVAQAEDLSQFAEASFDVVFLNSVFHWLPEKLGPLREARRVLKRGGRLGLSTAAKERPHDVEAVLSSVFARPDLLGEDEVPSGTPHKVSADELKRDLALTGFVNVDLHVRTFTDHFANAEEVVAFNLASSFGNFLSHLSRLTPERRAAAHRALDAELEQRRDAQGIALQRHLIFAVARAGS